MKYIRTSTIGEKEEIEGEPLEVMLLIQYIDNKDDCIVYTEEGSLYLDMGIDLEDFEDE